jgi:hypothetical protein
VIALFHRRDVAPTDVLAQLPKDERIVSWADVAGGGVVLASPAGLWWPERGCMRLIGWQYVTKARWQERTLSVIEAQVVDELLLVDQPVVSAVLSRPRDLPPTVRKRVEANVVRSELGAIVGGTARFVARRIPGQDGVRWWARLEPGTPDSPQIRSAVRARLAVLAAAWENERETAQRW